jgi:hypothetical protein
MLTVVFGEVSGAAPIADSRRPDRSDRAALSRGFAAGADVSALIAHKRLELLMFA